MYKDKFTHNIAEIKFETLLKHMAFKHILHTVLKGHDIRVNSRIDISCTTIKMCNILADRDILLHI
jgi:hypothetical protein